MCFYSKVYSESEKNFLETLQPGHENDKLRYQVFNRPLASKQRMSPTGRVLINPS